MQKLDSGKKFKDHPVRWFSILVHIGITGELEETMNARVLPPETLILSVQGWPRHLVT